MPPTEDDIGIDTIDRSIERLKLKKKTLSKVKNRLIQLEDTAELTVTNPVDSGIIHIIVKADEPLKMMEELAKIDFTLKGEAHTPDEIEYDVETGRYKLDKKFRVDR